MAAGDAEEAAEEAAAREASCCMFAAVTAPVVGCTRGAVACGHAGRHPQTGNASTVVEAAAMPAGAVSRSPV